MIAFIKCTPNFLLYNEYKLILSKEAPEGTIMTQSIQFKVYINLNAFIRTIIYTLAIKIKTAIK